MLPTDRFAPVNTDRRTPSHITIAIVTCNQSRGVLHGMCSPKEQDYKSLGVIASDVASLTKGHTLTK